MAGIRPVRWGVRVVVVFVSQKQNIPLEGFELGGDLKPFLEQLGAFDGFIPFASAGSSFPPAQVTSVPALRDFLAEYQRQLLIPVELPAILRAAGHAQRNEARELVALDQELASLPLLSGFSEASRRVGSAHLRRLKPLRDHRVVQRYLAAVEEGRAQGWHTLTFGLTLAVYSIPLRQGLLGYAVQTTRGFIRAAGRPLGISETQVHQLLTESAASIPAGIEKLLQPVLG